MSGNYDRVSLLVEAGMKVLAQDLAVWCRDFPLDVSQCRNVLKAGVQAALLGRSAQFYAAQWMAQVYSLKPDLALMRLLTKLDALCVSAAGFDDDTLARTMLK